MQMPFGKLKGKSIALVVNNEPRYVAWLLTLPAEFWARYPEAHREVRRRFAERLLWWLAEEERQRDRQDATHTEDIL